MPFPLPDLRTLIDRARSDMNARLPGADALLPVSNLNVLSMVHSASVFGLYGYLQWLGNQILVDTCEAEYLDRRGSIINFPRTPSARASGSAIFSGTDGTPVDAGTIFLRADGVRYITVDSGMVSGGVVTVVAEAETPGAAGNFSGGTCALLSAVPGLNSTVTLVGDGFTGGADIETDDAYRARLLARLRNPPAGGAKHDYEAWALSVPGVTRVWVYPLEMGLGTVVVRFVRDNDASLIPDGSEVAAVQAYIDTVRPITADVTVVAPVAVPLNFTISGLNPNTPEVKAAIQSELADLLAREAEPGATIPLSHIRAAISGALNEFDHTLVSPSADVTHTTGQLATMGVVTWA